MKEKEYYETVLAVLAEKIKEQDREIGYLKWQNEDLKLKLAEAEHHLNPHGEKPKSLEIR